MLGAETMMPVGSNPFISVVVPAHNAGQTVGAQLAALFAQVSDSPSEVIVVLNRCTDDTASVVREYQSVAQTAQVPLKVVIADERAGASYARNVGVAHAQGDVLLFCDADDIVEPGWIATMCAALRAADLVGGRLDLLEPVPQEVVALFPSFETLQCTALPLQWRRVAHPVSASMGCTRNIFTAASGFDEAFVHGGDDIAFALRVQRAGGRVAFVGGAVVRYRLRPTRRLAAMQRENYVRAEAKLIARYSPEEDEGFAVDVVRAAITSLRAMVPVPVRLTRRRWVLARASRVRVRELARERRALRHPVRPLKGPRAALRLLSFGIVRLPLARRSQFLGGIVRRYFEWQPIVDFTAPAELPLIGGLGLVAPRRDARQLAGWSDLGATLDALRQVVGPGAVVVDVGAHVGMFATAAAMLVGESGAVICFEPVPRLREALLTNLERHAPDVRLTIRSEAASASRGRVTFNSYPNGLLGGFGASTYSNLDAVPITVDTVALDDVVEGRIDLLKIDVEGAELSVLAGAQRTLDASPDAFVIAEVNLPSLASSGSDVAELLEVLGARGELWVLDESGQSPLRGRVGRLSEIRSWVDDAAADGVQWYANVLVVPASRGSLFPLAETSLAHLPEVDDHSGDIP